MLSGYDLTQYATQLRRDVLLKVPGPKPPLRFLRYIDEHEDPRAWWLEWTRRRRDIDVGPDVMPEQFPPCGLKLIVLRKGLLGPCDPGSVVREFAAPLAGLNVSSTS